MKITLITPTQTLSITVDEDDAKEIRMAVSTSLRSGFPAIFEHNEKIYMLPAELLKLALISIEEE